MSTTQKPLKPSEAKTPAKLANPLPLVTREGETIEVAKANTALLPSINAAMAIDAYQGNLLGRDASLVGLVAGLRGAFKEVEGGDLRNLEAMLIGQATALQTIFTSLARRAANQERLPQYQAFLGLALKAQAQSRATISALVELKYPRQATFVKQANIAHGPQQVNNGAAGGIAHEEQVQPEQSKLLEQGHANIITPQLDARAAQTAERSHPAVGAVESINRAKKPRGQSARRTQPVQGGPAVPTAPVHQGNEPTHARAKKPDSVTAPKEPLSDDEAFEAEFERQLDRQEKAFNVRNAAIVKTGKYIPPSDIELEVEAWLSQYC